MKQYISAKLKAFTLFLDTKADAGEAGRPHTPQKSSRQYRECGLIGPIRSKNSTFRFLESLYLSLISTYLM